MSNTVQELIKKAQESSSGRKTKNNDLYYDILSTLCEDDTYVSENVTGIKDGELFTEKRTLSKEFKEIIATAIKKSTSCTEAEAVALAESFKVSKKQAKVISDIVHEADYVAMKECGKKVQFFNKKGFSITGLIDEAPEVTRPNPQDATKVTIIHKRNKLKVQQKLHAFQKSVKIIKSGK